MNQSVTIPEQAYALRIVKTLVEENAFRYYQCFTLPRSPRAFVVENVNRCVNLGFLEKGEGFVLDILDEDVIANFPITLSGFKYLKAAYNFKVDRPASNQHYVLAR